MAPSRMHIAAITMGMLVTSPLSQRCKAQTPNPLHANVTCAFLKDYDHRYNDIVQHDMGSMNVSQCCALCKADVRCGIWVITPPGKCWIKSSYGIPTPAPGIISMCTVPGDPAVCPVPPPPPPPQHYICAGSQCVKGMARVSYLDPNCLGLCPNTTVVP